MSTEVFDAMGITRDFLFERVYLGEAARREHGRIDRMLRALVEHYATHLPPALTPEATDAERVADYLAGMTDRYAIKAFADLSVPQGF